MSNSRARDVRDEAVEQAKAAAADVKDKAEEVSKEIADRSADLRDRVQEETDKRREDAAEKLADVATKIEETAENQGGVAGSAGHAIAEGLNRASTAVEPKRSPLRKAVNSAISHPFVTLLLLAICIIIVRIMVSKKNDSVT